MIEAPGPIRFADLMVAPDARHLTGPAGVIELQDKPLRLLLALLDRPGEIVPREALQDALWPPDLHVEREAGLNTAMRKLRRGLSEVGSKPEIIETVAGVGYRLDVPAHTVVPEKSRRPVSRPPGRGRMGVAAALGALAVTAIFSASGAPGGAAPERLPRDAEARTLYVEAHGHVGRGDLATARELFAAVAVAEPGFAPGHAYKAELAALLALGSNDAALVAEAEAAAATARRLAPDLAVGLRARGLLELHFRRDLPAALGLLQRAARIDPDDAVNHLALAGYYSIVGDHDRAVTLVEHAVRVDPDTMAVRSDAGYFLLRAERYAEAVRECEMVLRLAPDNAFARHCLLEAHARLGDTERTRQQARELMRAGGAPVDELARLAGTRDPERVYRLWALTRLQSGTEPPPVHVATHHMRLGQPAEALHWLERAAAAHSPDLLFVPAGPAFAALRTQPQYRAVLRQAGLAHLLPS